MKPCKCKNSPILVVDDNHFNLMTLKLLIKDKFNIEPDVAIDGLEAVNKFKSKLLRNESTCK